ncbi:MAG: hypothetical protein QM772_15855 [Ottowia sp.]|uniref:hypothetical protein n=1 Tax=Ottowia sp. TaxID=1898956 RepID=UPI0039E54B4D
MGTNVFHLADYAVPAYRRRARIAAARPVARGPARPAVRVTQPTAGAGELRISGRLVDVCAELERLAAIEAAQTPPQPRRA